MTIVDMYLAFCVHPLIFYVNENIKVNVIVQCTYIFSINEKQLSYTNVFLNRLFTRSIDFI